MNPERHGGRFWVGSLLGEEMRQRLRDWNGANAEEGGLEPGRLAECFRVMDTR